MAGWYNGFSPEQRARGGKFHKAQIRQGIKPEKPTHCDGCGVTNGYLQWHSEDYSEPFGDHIGQYGLCYICHMMIHCRHKNPSKWFAYAQLIEEGGQYVPYESANWPAFRESFLLGVAEKPEGIYGDQHPNSLILKLFKGE